MINELKRRYAIADKWRSAWLALANKVEHGRLQSRQEYIQNRAELANMRIKQIMDEFDEL